MNFIYKNKNYCIPSSLSEITLKQRIDFDKIYLSEIEKRKEDLYKVDEEGNVIKPDEVDEMIFNIKIASMNFSFFSGIPLDEVEKNIPLEDVLAVYHSCFKQIYEEQTNLNLQENYLFHNEIWKIDTPMLTFESKITFNEFIVSKQIIKQMDELGAGNWEAMLYLSAIFLKRENEVFQEEWLSSNSERLKLMETLPMDIAIAVAFFLQTSMIIYLKTSPYSAKEVMEKDPI